MPTDARDERQSSDGRRRRRARWLTGAWWSGPGQRLLWSIVGLLAAGVALVFAVLIGAGTVEPDVATAVGGLVLVAALAAVLGPFLARALTGGSGSVSLSFMGVDLVVDAAAAARQSGGDEDASAKGGDGSDSGDALVDLRLNLEQKLAYVAKHLLPGDGPDGHGPAFVTIGSLGYDGYITDEQARTAARLTLDRAAIDSLPPAARKTFLAEASKLVRNFRASVLRGLVTETLKDDGWGILEIPRPGSARPDLLVEKAGRRYRLATPFVNAYEWPPKAGAEQSGDIVAKAWRRLRSTRNGARIAVDRRVVVVPPDSKVADGADNDPMVVRVDELVERLDAFSDRGRHA